MPSKNPDQVRIKHMIDAIEEALSFIEGKSIEDLDDDRMLTLSLVKEIEMLGEAAQKISSEFREQHPQIPWQLIVHTRNRLIHGYFDIDEEIIWKTLTQDLPGLLRQLMELKKK